MRNRVAWGAVVVGGLLLPALAHPQASPPADRVSAEMLMAEIRLLRQAIERQSAMAARTNLLVGRLTLQDQRIARLRATADRLDEELSGVASDRSRARAALAELQRAVEQATDDARRTQLESELRMEQARMKDRDARLADLQTRQGQARQALDAEGARLEELESSLSQLERGLSPPSR